MTRTPYRSSVLLVLFFFALASWAQTANQRVTQNVIMVMTDGLRWQEVFRGAEASLMTKAFKVKDGSAFKKTYWRETPEARREALMPFLWGTVAKQGQIYGNRDKGSDAYVTNSFFFSYPGYSETLCGFPDPRVNSNDNFPNPNVTVLEWLSKKPEFQGKIAGFGAWARISAIINTDRSGVPVVAGLDPLTTLPGNPRVDLLNRLKLETPQVWDEEPFDVVPFYTALEYLKERKPRVLYLSLGETDEWAHGGDYVNYLAAAHRVDQYIRVLWETVQSMPEYKDKTTLMFSPDHGRGDGAKWTDHGTEVPNSKYIWMAFLGPDTPSLGARSQTPAVTQSQIAATLAGFLGQDYHANVPKAGKPVAEALLH